MLSDIIIVAWGNISLLFVICPPSFVMFMPLLVCARVQFCEHVCMCVYACVRVCKILSKLLSVCSRACLWSASECLYACVCVSLFVFMTRVCLCACLQLSININLPHHSHAALVLYLLILSLNYWSGTVGQLQSKWQGCLSWSATQGASRSSR